jgi:hypothetical protein
MREIVRVNGMYDDSDGFGDSVQIIKRAIMGDVMNEVVLHNEIIQEIDLALEKIMTNGNGSKRKSKRDEEQRLEAEADEDSEEYDDNYDGNEWDD